MWYTVEEMAGSGLNRHGSLELHTIQAATHQVHQTRAGADTE